MRALPASVFIPIQRRDSNSGLLGEFSLSFALSFASAFASTSASAFAFEREGLDRGSGFESARR